jgi:hypothetical protein
MGDADSGISSPLPKRVRFDNVLPASEYLSKSVTADRVKHMSFHDLCFFCKQKETIHITAKTLCTILQKNAKPGPLLGAYVIKYHPETAFDHKIGDLERLLQDLAEKVIETWEILLVQTTIVSPEALNTKEQFIREFDEYVTNFNIWKEPELEQLKIRVFNALDNLYAVESLLPEDDESMAAEFNTMIQRLRSKSAELFGNDAVVEYDQRRAESV